MTSWIGVASRDHVKVAIKGGFAQAGHGKMAPVKRMKRGDHILHFKKRMPKVATILSATNLDAPHGMAVIRGGLYRTRSRLIDA